MTWEQRFGALIELDGDEWDAAYKRLEQEWLAAYTAAFVEIAVSRTRAGRLRKTLSRAKSHPDCPIRASPQRTFPHGSKPQETVSE